MKQDRLPLVSLGLDYLSNFCGFWAIGVGSSCLVLGSRMIRAGAIIGSVQEIKEVIGDKGFGLVGLHMKDVSPGRGFLSRISKAPKMSKHHKIQKILKQY